MKELAILNSEENDLTVIVDRQADFSVKTNGKTCIFGHKRYSEVFLTFLQQWID